MPLSCQDAVQDLEAFGDDFLTDAVTGDYCDVQCHVSIFPRSRALVRAGSNPVVSLGRDVPHRRGRGREGTHAPPAPAQDIRSDQIHAPEDAK